MKDLKILLLIFGVIAFLITFYVNLFRYPALPRSYQERFKTIDEFITFYKKRYRGDLMIFKNKKGPTKGSVFEVDKGSVEVIRNGERKFCLLYKSRELFQKAKMWAMTSDITANKYKAYYDVVCIHFKQ